MEVLPEVCDVGKIAPGRHRISCAQMRYNPRPSSAQDVGVIIGVTIKAI